jgi:hypothetical protein
MAVVFAESIGKPSPQRLSYLRQKIAKQWTEKHLGAHEEIHRHHYHIGLDKIITRVEWIEIPNHQSAIGA